MPRYRPVTVGAGLRRLAAALAIALAGPAFAEDVAGDFDFYVLSLSWSPGYCAYDDRPDPRQCDLKLPGFTVHGLWPQFESGWPQYCRTNDSFLPRSTVSGIADIMPSPGLARYQWEKHGVCSGLRAERYFDLLRQATGAVKIPPQLVAPRADVAMTPQALEDAFVAANAGLQTRGIAVSCPRSGEIEVRVCLTKSLQFRRCAEVDRDTCRRSQVTLPAVR